MAARARARCRRLYNEMKAAPVKPALGQLWSKLGIEIQGKETFDQSAPWASVRRAIAADNERVKPPDNLAGGCAPYKLEDLQPSWPWRISAVEAPAGAACDLS